MLWVNGDEWFDVLQGTSGTVDPRVRDRFDAEFALMGRVMPVDRREDLSAAMQGDSSGVAEHLAAAQERAMNMATSARTRTRPPAPVTTGTSRSAIEREPPTG